MENSLNKPFKAISGLVEPGDKRGTSLGFPTANLTLIDSEARPADGVYACHAQISGEDVVYIGALHVGPRPTFEGATASVEVHLLSFPYRELYGATISCTNLTFIRSIGKFNDETELIDALTDDANRARQLLA